eukprot:TRINITY_DN41971_c0_g1_i1.p1 TRINITY_DN41971_c0_g1~~TRINITY_DN41971_c0_g1_i1.p1  ORF type:complete len:900 (-),score=134.92 TRINITY_DN41971_c0_g1_i1:285-2984(-)
MSMLREFLAQLGLSQYADTFLSNGFDDMSTLMDAHDSDFKELGLKVGHRRKLLTALASLRKQETRMPDPFPLQPAQSRQTNGGYAGTNPAYSPCIGDKMQQIVELLQRCGANADGVINPAMLEGVFQKLGDNGMTDIPKMIRFLGRNSKGRVRVEDFAAWVFHSLQVEKVEEKLNESPGSSARPQALHLKDLDSGSKLASSRRVSPWHLSTEPLSPSLHAFHETVPEVHFGVYRFRSAEAAPYLARYTLEPDLLDRSNWTATSADVVAHAVMDWAVARGASMVCHITQPLRSANGTWRGSEPSRMVHALFDPDHTGKTKSILNGTYLLRGESESRKMIDITSPMWVRGDTLFIPSVFANYNNSSYADADPVIDEKTPLLRAMQAVSRSGVRLLKLLGHDCESVLPKIGLEQEFFLVTRAAYDRRPDLQQCGRTIMGAVLENCTCLYDQHSTPQRAVAESCMAEIQQECFKLGIHLRTRHRESAPNQYEFAPHFGIASAQVDENLLVMEIIEQTALKHGLVALLHEKPFEGVNGSGKHNNFSLGTDTGINLFHDEHLNKISAEAFPVVMAAVASAVYRHGDLLVSATACPGNDFRLTKGGGCEAPPSCVSVHLGDTLTTYLTDFMEGNPIQRYAPSFQDIALNVDTIDRHKVRVSGEPRNRTAPLPYAGRRFELRTPGASQNVSSVNVVLCTVIAEAFNEFSDAIASGMSARDVAVRSLKAEGLKAVYNDNNYKPEWLAEAKERGLTCVDSMVEGMQLLRSPKSIALFGKFGVMDETELEERADVLQENYAISAEIEARCMVDMVRSLVIPAARKAGEALCQQVSQLVDYIARLSDEVHALLAVDEMYDRARQAQDMRLCTMVEIRKICDEVERNVPAETWPLATYRELLLNDMFAPLSR